MGKCITWLIYLYVTGIIITGLNYILVIKVIDLLVRKKL